MTAESLDGRALAAGIQASNRVRAQALASSLGLVPRIGVLLVGDDPAGELYARRVRRSCKEALIENVEVRLAAESGTDDVVQIIEHWRSDPTISGMLVQLPLPASIDQQRVVSAVDPDRDIDGIGPVNFGRVAMGLSGFAPCTAEAIVELAKRSGARLPGIRCVVVGRSNIVGKPAALLMLREHATVTICHSRTRDLELQIRQAELVIAAVGQPGLIRGDMLTPGCIVIDAGTTPTPDGLMGDVDAYEAKEVAAMLTPVPGGVGPITNALLIRHALEAAERMNQRAT